MRVDVKQVTGLADYFVEIPETELDTLGGIIDWEAISKLVASIETDYDPLSLFRMMLLQTWHNLSDERIANALRRDIVYMRFCGFTLEGKKPDASTLCRFRKRLNKNKLFEKLLEAVNESLEARDLKVSKGKYVSTDATLIASARRPRKTLESRQNEDGSYETDGVTYSDDKEASWLKRGSKLVYGYNGTVTTDEDGLVESVSTRPVNESEMTNFADIVDEARLSKGRKVLYDKGADSAANRDALKARKLKDGIMRKKPKGQEMGHWTRLRNSLISQKRFVTERTFGTLKRVYGMGRARYIGIKKVHGELLLKSMAYNIKRAMNRYKRNEDEVCLKSKNREYPFIKGAKNWTTSPNVRESVEQYPQNNRN